MAGAPFAYPCTMSRTIRLPAPSPAPSNPADTSDLLASVAGEEDPGAAVDAPVPPPRASTSGAKPRGAPDAPVPPQRGAKKKP